MLHFVDCSLYNTSTSIAHQVYPNTLLLLYYCCSLLYYYYYYCAAVVVAALSLTDPTFARNQASPLFIGHIFSQAYAAPTRAGTL